MKSAQCARNCPGKKNEESPIDREILKKCQEIALLIVEKQKEVSRKGSSPVGAYYQHLEQEDGQTLYENQVALWGTTKHCDCSNAQPLAIDCCNRQDCSANAARNCNCGCQHTGVNYNCDYSECPSSDCCGHSNCSRKVGKIPCPPPLPSTCCAPKCDGEQKVKQIVLKGVINMGKKPATSKCHVEWKPKGCLKTAQTSTDSVKLKSKIKSRDNSSMTSIEEVETYPVKDVRYPVKRNWIGWKCFS